MPEKTGNISINISTGTIVKTIGLLLLIALAYYLKDLILIIMTSVVIAAAVEPATKYFMSFRFPRALAVLAVYVLFFLFFFGVLYLFVPQLFQDLSGLSASLPAKISSLGGSAAGVDPLSSVTGGLAKSFSLKELIGDLERSFQTLSASFFDATSILFGGALSFILILVISFYLAVQEKGIENFLRLVTPIKSEAYVLDLWARSQVKIGKWMQGQIILGLIVGLLVFLGLTILQVKYALALGIIAALFEIIPFFGPIISAVPGVLLGFSDNVTAGLMVMGLYIIVQQFENHLIYPLVVKKIVGVPPIIVVIALIIGAKLAGFLGIILAAPVATILLELASDIEKKKARNV